MVGGRCGHQRGKTSWQVKKRKKKGDRKEINSLGGLLAPSKRGCACDVAAVPGEATEPIAFWFWWTGGILRLPDLACGRYSDMLVVVLLLVLEDLILVPVLVLVLVLVLGPGPTGRLGVVVMSVSRYLR